jgi:sugar diacid utilization regulator
VVALLGEQLFRAALRRSQSAGFLRRLVSDSSIVPERAREEAAAVGITLAEAYWPVVVAPESGALRPADVEAIDREARRLAPGSLTVAVRGSAVLLMPASGSAPASEADVDAMAWLELVVARIRDLVPALNVRAIAADDTVELDNLSALVARLVRLCAYSRQAQPACSVARARKYALAGFLRDSVAPAQARTFVDDLLGDLIAWDAEHGSDLLRVLEAALDSPRQDVAARRCFMHRNTFRHRYHKALEVLGDDLEDPEMRLAVHVGLKLRRGR